MTKKIFQSILIVAAVVLAASFAMILGVLYDYYTGVLDTQLQTQATLIAKGIGDEGVAYFDGLRMEGCRATWIGSDGTVLYDSDAEASSLESHADREEFMEALASGVGRSARYSATMTERMLYYAERLADGSVIRTANAQNTVLALVLSMTLPLLIVLAIAILLSAVLASKLSKRIVKPLNALDLDDPLRNAAYDELSPLLTRIARQHRQIDAQLQELHRKQEEWNAVTGSMNEGIVLLSESNAILSINESAAAILHTTASCVGEDLLAVCRRLDIQALLEKMATGQKAEMIAAFDGAEYQVNASSVLSDGKAKGAALLFFDVTDRAHAELMRREFTANVSHELKTPLHIISGTAELMKSGLVKPEDMDKFIDTVYSEAQRMVALVEDIIELSRLDEGVENAPRERIRLKSIAESAAQQLQPAAQKENIDLRVCGDDVTIYGIPSLIGELVYNLCENAVKYNKTGGSVDILLEDAQTAVILTVSDTGVGIPAESRERIFERFYRVDKSRSKAIGGTGLGLSIVKHVARLHGANLSVTSEIGQGATFRVEFPK